jgi:hypothetical protein
MLPDTPLNGDSNWTYFAHTVSDLSSKHDSIPEPCMHKQNDTPKQIQISLYRGIFTLTPNFCCKSAQNHTGENLNEKHNNIHALDYSM